ncbi:methionine--tRNA ligase [Candidatus Woesearchaeota archaeon]|jgi:methionyl-tRNA synthetase|nr:methionine--tRNA ligase [Candidatus Woesearchaeota archaeon]
MVEENQPKQTTEEKATETQQKVTTETEFNAAEQLESGEVESLDLAQAEMENSMPAKVNKAELSDNSAQETAELDNNEEKMMGTMVGKVNKERKKVLITSALPYVNNVPHLGNIIGCVLSADVFARFCRLKDWDTLYICGTDEHGTATETKAIEEGLTPKQICDKYYAIHKQVYEWFGCSFDAFGRTSAENHKDMTQSLFKKLYANGLISKNDVEQLFCENCDKFLSDRFVEGECPHCNSDKARGDQCDSCGKLLNAVELIDPKCKTCGAEPTLRVSKHLFLDLPKMQKQLNEWADMQMDLGDWPVNARRITKAWLKEGLKERCISRDLKWGVPIPLDGYTDKVFYVWFDAPIGYISITQSVRPDWKEWWSNPDIKLYQFMAKDNVAFHSIIFPATLMGTNDSWNLVYHLASTEYLNYESGKFSKSYKQGVFGDDAISTGIKPDVWRYYLLINRPENSDTQFTWKDFQEKNNNELLANLGNFVNRALTFTKKSFEGKIPEVKLEIIDKEFIFEINKNLMELNQHLEAVKLKDALRTIMHISRLGNQYFQTQEPWAAIKTDISKASTTLAICTNLVKLLGVIVQPFLPFTSKEIGVQLNMDLSKESWPLEFFIENCGHEIGEPKAMFSKLEDDFILELQTKFSGDQQIKDATNERKQYDLFVAVDLRVGKVISVNDHPGAEKLYILKLDLGSEERQLVAGLKGHLSKDEICGKKIVIVSNLKPAKLRGELSQGMILAAETKEKVVLVQAVDAELGERVFVKGVESKPVKDLDIKEFAKINLTTDSDGQIVSEEGILETETGDVVAKGIGSGATIR